MAATSSAVSNVSLLQRLMPMELVLVRFRETPPDWLHWLPRLGIPHTVYTQGKGPMLGMTGLHEELMQSNVGREGYVYLSHVLRHGARARQTVFCQMVPRETELRFQFRSLGVRQRFDMLSSVAVLSKDPGFVGLTYLWSGVRTLPKYLGMSARDSANRTKGFYRPHNSSRVDLQ